VSIFSAERAEAIARELGVSVKPGDLAENITVKGIDLEQIKPATRILAGESLLEVTQIGKDKGDIENHTFSFHGRAPLMTEGVYCRVIKSGKVKTGDSITVVE
jgi:MOSC domain-containing protein YiiM